MYQPYKFWLCVVFDFSSRSFLKSFLLSEIEKGFCRNIKDFGRGVLVLNSESLLQAEVTTMGILLNSFWQNCQKSIPLREPSKRTSVMIKSYGFLTPFFRADWIFSIASSALVDQSKIILGSMLFKTRSMIVDISISSSITYTDFRFFVDSILLPPSPLNDTIVIINKYADILLNTMMADFMHSIRLCR